MNWLAHLFLSEPTPAFRVGNLLPDLAPMSALRDLSPDIRRGVETHRAIDAFTDSHPVVRRSIKRFQPPYRRYGGILTDVFYDHFLARDWEEYSPEPLPVFLAEFYESFPGVRSQIPADAYTRLQQMKTEDWLGSYSDLPGITITLQRISTRLKRPFALAGAVSLLENQYEAFHADFTEFFPELMAAAGSKPAPGTLRNILPRYS